MSIENRPYVHFTPAKGWINDPNGMVYINGEYHLFYQHYPDALHWGPMHWGHAVSRDLLHWEHLPIAIYPDELGVIFSGSCFYDRENLSGFASKDIPFFGIKGKPPLVAIFTSHYMAMVDGKPVGKEQQSIAYSTDLVHFEKYYGNPVISNDTKKDFRDPKAFWNPVKKCVSLVLAAGKCVEFYASKDLKNWEKTGEFEPAKHGLDGICECPDCFPVIAEDGTEKWVLFISMIVPPEKRCVKNDRYDRMTHISQYFIGEFDGDTFHDTEHASEGLILDYGTDNYAPVTFQNLDEKVMIGWGNNWEYARGTCPTEGYNGRMTLARRIGMRKMEEGYRLCYSFEGLENLMQTSRKLEQGENRLRMDAFGIRVTAGTCGKITICNRNGEKLLVELSDTEIIVDRSAAGRNDFHEAFAKESLRINRAPRKNNKDAALDLVWDRSILEVIADQGLVGFTVNAYPEYYYDAIVIEGDLEAEIYEVK